MNKNIVWVLVVVGVLLCGVLTWQLISTDYEVSSSMDGTAVVPTEDPIDVTMELYRPWLSGLRATSTAFDIPQLLDTAPVTADLRSRLQQAISDSQSEIDPVLCQVDTPERIGVKTVFTNDTESQLMVVARGTKVPEQALVTLAAIDGRWLISDIVCSLGEVAPELEYTFEREGNLLKQSLLPPLNNEQWHLIYTRDGVAGNAIPLLFDAESRCIGTDGSEQVCVPDQLTEATAVTIQGSMQEAGALVERMELQ